MFKLQPLRIPSGWQIDFNKLEDKDISTSEDLKEYFELSEDILGLSITQENYQIDIYLGWYPEFSLDGSFALEVINDIDLREKPLEYFENCKNKDEIIYMLENYLCKYSEQPKFKLQPLRLNTNWKVIHNNFYELDPSELGLCYENGENILHLQKVETSRKYKYISDIYLYWVCDNFDYFKLEFIEKKVLLRKEILFEAEQKVFESINKHRIIEILENINRNKLFWRHDIMKKLKLIENIHYYNNSFKVTNEVLFIDRVYMFDEYEFTQDDYKNLDIIFNKLPYFIGYTPCATWFGEDDKDEFWLWVSFEPSGLQFCGNLKLEDFKLWENNFHKLVENYNFPFKYK